MADPASISAASIAIGQTAYTYAQFLPSLREVRQAGPTDMTMRGDVLLGQVTAGMVSMTVGWLLSWMSGSQLPLLTTLAIAIIIAAAYQYALIRQTAESE